MTRSRTRELELRVLLEGEKPDVVALSETELDEEDSSFHVPGYTVFYSSPYANKVRVLLLLKDSLARRLNPRILAVSHQEIWMKMACPSGTGTWTFAACYRQWTGAETTDFSNLCDNIRKYSSSSSRVVLAGDFNLDVARQNDSLYYRRAMISTFLSELNELGFVLENSLDTPTYKSHGCFNTATGPRHRESVLDLVLSLGTQDRRPEVRVLPNAAGDHRPVLAVYSVNRLGATMAQRRCRDFKRVTPGALLMAVNAAKISEVFMEEDVDKIAEIIVGEIVAALDLIAPVRPVLIKDRVVPLSLAKETREIMAARDAAAQRRDWPLYRKLRNLAARRVRRDRMRTNLVQLNKCAGDPKQLWRLADSLTGRGKSCALPPSLVHEGQLVRGEEELADVMNRHYISKIAMIRHGIAAELKQQQQQCQQGQQQQRQQGQQQQRQQGQQQQRQQGQQQQRQQGQQQQEEDLGSASSSSSFVLRAPTEGEVLKAVMKLRNTPALGEDGVPTSVIKDLGTVLSAPLAHLARRSFISKKFPTAFKTANVVPIFKRGKDPTLPSSYRPVAILCAISKVLESLVLAQLVPFLAPRLPQEQWGFRPARSTSGALAAAQGSWLRSRVRGETVAVAAFDFSSAFDTLGVEELVLKLRRLDIGEDAVLWFRDYLSNRLQRVRYGSACSSLRSVSYGVPQGSLLGPVLFTALISDLPLAVSGLESIGITLYADDTCLWSAHRDPGVVKRELELASSRLLSYALANSLALNPAKTQLLWTNDPSPVLVGDTLVQPQDELLLLGIRFDRRLSIGPHLQSLSSSARSLLALTRRLLLHLPRGGQVQDVVRALVVGKLCYGSILVPPRLSPEDPTSQLLQSIQTSVNDIARLLLGTRRADRIPVERLLDLTGMPALNRVVIKTILCETWKCLHSCDGPDGGMNPLGVMLSPPTPPSNRVTRSISAGSLPPPLRIRADTFAWFAAVLYNDVPLIRSAPTLAAARRAAESFSSAAPL